MDTEDVVVHRPPQRTAWPPPAKFPDPPGWKQSLEAGALKLNDKKATDLEPEKGKQCVVTQEDVELEIKSDLYTHFRAIIEEADQRDFQIYETSNEINQNSSVASQKYKDIQSKIPQSDAQYQYYTYPVEALYNMYNNVDPWFDSVIDETIQQQIGIESVYDAINKRLKTDMGLLDERGKETLHVYVEALQEYLDPLVQQAIIEQGLHQSAQFTHMAVVKFKVNEDDIISETFAYFSISKFATIYEHDELDVAAMASLFDVYHVNTLPQGKSEYMYPCATGLRIGDLETSQKDAFAQCFLFTTDNENPFETIETAKDLEKRLGIGIWTDDDNEPNQVFSLVPWTTVAMQVSKRESLLNAMIRDVAKVDGEGIDLKDKKYCSTNCAPLMLHALESVSQKLLTTPENAALVWNSMTEKQRKAYLTHLHIPELGEYKAYFSENGWNTNNESIQKIHQGNNAEIKAIIHMDKKEGTVDENSKQLSIDTRMYYHSHVKQAEAPRISGEKLKEVLIQLLHAGQGPVADEFKKVVGTLEEDELKEYLYSAADNLQGYPYLVQVLNVCKGESITWTADQWEAFSQVPPLDSVVAYKGKKGEMQDAVQQGFQLWTDQQKSMSGGGPIRCSPIYFLQNLSNAFRTIIERVHGLQSASNKSDEIIQDLVKLKDWHGTADGDPVAAYETWHIHPGILQAIVVYLSYTDDHVDTIFSNTFLEGKTYAQVQTKIGQNSRDNFALLKTKDYEVLGYGQIPQITAHPLAYLVEGSLTVRKEANSLQARVPIGEGTYLMDTHLRHIAKIFNSLSSKNDVSGDSVAYTIPGESRVQFAPMAEIVGVGEDKKNDKWWMDQWDVERMQWKEDSPWTGKHIITHPNDLFLRLSHEKTDMINQCSQNTMSGGRGDGLSYIQFHDLVFSDRTYFEIQSIDVKDDDTDGLRVWANVGRESQKVSLLHIQAKKGDTETTQKKKMMLVYQFLHFTEKQDWYKALEGDNENRLLYSESMRAAIRAIIKTFKKFDADTFYNTIEDGKVKEEWDECKEQDTNRRGPFPGPDLQDDASIEKAKHWAFQAAPRQKRRVRTG